MRDPWFHHRRSSQLAHEERKNSEAPSEVHRRATQPNRLSSSSPRSPSFEFVCRLAPAIGWPTTEVERRPFPPFFGHATFLVIDGMEMRSARIRRTFAQSVVVRGRRSTGSLSTSTSSIKNAEPSKRPYRSSASQRRSGHCDDNGCIWECAEEFDWMVRKENFITQIFTIQNS